MEVQCTAAETLFIATGDDDGIVSRDPKSGEPRFGVQNACLARRQLLDYTAGERWQHDGSYDHLGLRPLGDLPPIHDPRCFGLYSMLVQNKRPVQFLDQVREARVDWRASLEAKRWHVVSRTKPDDPRGDIFVDEWILDPELDDAIISVSTHVETADGQRKLLARAESKYERKGGKWWPCSGEIRSPTGLNASWTFTGVEWEPSDFRQKLTPDAMDIPIGTLVYKAGFPGDEGVQEMRYIGAGETIPQKKWDEMRDGVNLDAHKSFREKMRALGTGYYPSWWGASSADFGIANVARQPDEWEKYVRRWIIRRSPARGYSPTEPLTEKQINAAWAVLKDCRRKAGLIDTPVDVARVDAAASDSAGIKPPVERGSDREVERLFHELQARLDGLLTSAQRADTLASGGGPARR